MSKVVKFGKRWPILVQFCSTLSNTLSSIFQIHSQLSGPIHANTYIYVHFTLFSVLLSIMNCREIQPIYAKISNSMAMMLKTNAQSCELSRISLIYSCKILAGWRQKVGRPHDFSKSSLCGENLRKLCKISV